MILAIQAIIAILLSLCILVQHRSSGLSSTFGGGGVTYVQRRGAERVLYRATIVLSAAFLLLTILDWYV